MTSAFMLWQNVFFYKNVKEYTKETKMKAESAKSVEMNWKREDVLYFVLFSWTILVEEKM